MSFLSFVGEMSLTGVLADGRTVEVEVYEPYGDNVKAEVDISILSGKRVLHTETVKVSENLLFDNTEEEIIAVLEKSVNNILTHSFKTVENKSVRKFRDMRF